MDARDEQCVRDHEIFPFGLAWAIAGQLRARVSSLDENSSGFGADHIKSLVRARFESREIPLVAQFRQAPLQRFLRSLRQCGEMFKRCDAELVDIVQNLCVAIGKLESRGAHGSLVSKSYHPPSILKSCLAFSSTLVFNTLGCLLLSVSGRAKRSARICKRSLAATSSQHPLLYPAPFTRTTAETTETALNGGWSRRCVIERCFACLERAAPRKGLPSIFTVF